jgi:hypothetical protein
MITYCRNGIEVGYKNLKKKHENKFVFLLAIRRCSFTNQIQINDHSMKNKF